MNASSINAKKSSPLVNAAIIAILLLTALPIAIFGIMQILPPLSDASAKNVVEEDTARKRSSAAERRAERREARKAKGLAAAPRMETAVVTVDPGFDMDVFDGFGMMAGDEMDAFGGFDGFDGFDGFGSFGMMPGDEMGGFGGFGDNGWFYGDQV